MFGVCCVALLIARWELGAPSAIATLAPKLAVREEPGRVVLAWNGPIEKPMRGEIAAAIGRFKADTRPLVISFNSPGGSIAHGREVMAVIRDASRKHRIDTLVENGGVCASMCVPIYLIGTQRSAHPKAHFMFHEASLMEPVDPEISPTDRKASLPFRKAIEALATDDLFANDIATQRVNMKWLTNMRTRIAGREVWLTGQQLVDESSGIVEALVGTAAK